MTVRRCPAATTDDDGFFHTCGLRDGHTGDHRCHGDMAASFCRHTWPTMTADDARRVCIAQTVRAIEQADNSGDPMAALLGLHSLLRSSEWADLEVEL